MQHREKVKNGLNGIKKWTSCESTNNFGRCQDSDRQLREFEVDTNLLRSDFLENNRSPM